jgi:hypothetical protein
MSVTLLSTKTSAVFAARLAQHLGVSVADLLCQARQEEPYSASTSRRRLVDALCAFRTCAGCP